MTIPDECEGRTKQLPRNNQILMLSIAGCNGNHIAPRDRQQREYAEVVTARTPKTTCKYAQEGVYVAKGKYSKYAEDGVYSVKGKYSRNMEEDASVEEGHNEPLAKEGNNKPLVKDRDWAEYDDKSLATRVIGRVCLARQQ